MKKIYGILFASVLICSPAFAESSYYLDSSASYQTDDTVTEKEYSEQASNVDTNATNKKKSKRNFSNIIKPAIYNPQDLNAGSYYKRRYNGY